MQELLKALVKAKQSFGVIPKDKKGNRGKYSSLNAVLSAVEPALLSVGLCVIQKTQRDGEEFYLESTLYHVSGEFITATYPLLTGGDSQKIGSALTYARRYSLCALLSVVADEDDDGEATTQSVRGGLEKPKESISSPLADEVKELITYARENGLEVAEIKALCSASGLPATAAQYKTQAQVTTLSELIENEIAKRSV